MSFRTHVSASINFTGQALERLSHYDSTQPPTVPANRRVLFQAQQFASPYATDEGARALDDARYDRTVGRWAIRQLGQGLESLDGAWWAMRGRSGDLPDVTLATQQLNDAVHYLQAARSRGGRTLFTAA